MSKRVAGGKGEWAKQKTERRAAKRETASAMPIVEPPVNLTIETDANGVNVWCHLEDGNPLSCSESFVIGTAPTLALAIFRAARELSEMVARLAAVRQGIDGKGERLYRVPDTPAETAAPRCANCGHTDPHTGPAGDVADACTHPACVCGYFGAETAAPADLRQWAQKKMEDCCCSDKG